MKKISIILFVFFTVLGYSQKTLFYADSIRVLYSIPEISYAVVDEKSVLEFEALGKHSVALDDLASKEDRFHIGSNTKAMTAFMIAKYVEKGKLQWTTKFFDLFPEWKANSKKEYLNITLQDLLSHRAGVQAFQGFNDPKIPDFYGTKQEKRKLFGEFVLTLEPVKIDAENTFIYSNAGYTLATLMVEKATGMSWEELVDKVFNKDLKLEVKLSWPDNQKQKDTWGHTTENGKLQPVPSTFDYHLDFTEPAGDINIKLKNYLTYIQMNLQGLKGRNNYLKASTYQFIHKGISNYSLGWFNVYENNNELSTHSGTAGTYYSLVHIDRLKNKAYIIFTNSFSDATQQGVRLLMRRLKQNYSIN
nr:serine hydrolase domain-containing protein [uncultured Flavobacterium sp.]